MDRMGAWVVGNNLAGFLPESDTYAFAEWADAAEYLEASMREYADADDDAAYTGWADADDAELEDWDQPSMLAHVEAIFGDNDGPQEGQDWSTWVEDNSYRRIVFFLAWSDDREPEDDYDV
jgi:hypothetical protein